ncbi:MAG: response regulator, partial [Nitrospinaceae bacterium]|nr:response regulator [Nitrospinaceae bacterium]
MERTAQAHAFKGWIIFEAGQTNLAEGEFNKALKIDARNPLARSGLRELREKQEQEKKGMFKKMFR